MMSILDSRTDTLLIVEDDNQSRAIIDEVFCLTIACFIGQILKGDLRSSFLDRNG